MSAKDDLAFVEQCRRMHVRTGTLPFGRVAALFHLAERARAVAAEKSCEDWQECAGHLALALKNAVHPSVYSAEVAMALAEFDRLADESTKGVEL